jgi:hypothetical protein
LFFSFALNVENIIEIDLTQVQFGEIHSEQIFEDFAIIPLNIHKNALLKIKTVLYYLTEKYIIARISLEMYQYRDEQSRINYRKTFT